MVVHQTYLASVSCAVRAQPYNGAMKNKASKAPTDLVATDLPEFLEDASRRSWPLESHRRQGPPTYRIAFREEPIQLGYVEFHIMLFLASRPYHAFTRRSIADAVSTQATPVDEASVDHFVASLRNQLGVFHDYVQTVPYIGFRFKP